MRSRPAREIAGALMVLGGLAAGCGQVKSPTEPAAVPPAAAFSFARVQNEIFTPSCAKAGCHAAATASGGLVLEAGSSYGQIVNRPSTENGALDRIEPGDPERSYLIKKLRGDPDISGSRMPLDRPGSLTREQMDGLAGWVLAGAPGN